MSATEESLERAVGTLIDKSSYYSPFVSFTRFHMTEQVPTVGIGWYGDNIHVFCNPEYFEALSEVQRRGVLKHEYAHYQLRHLTGSRNLKLNTIAAKLFPDDLYRLPLIVNIAEDLEINGTVVPKDELPEGGQFAEHYDWEYGLLAEEYLHLMAEDVKKIRESGMDGDVQLDELMDDLDEKELEGRLKEAQSRGDSPGGLDRLLEKLRPPVLTWKKMFRNKVLSVLKSKLIIPTFGRPNRRGLAIPGHIYRNLPNCYVFQDTSGSISNDNLAHLSSEIYGIRKYTRKIIVLVIDAALHTVYTFKNKIESVKGGGGSDFTEAFEYVDNQTQKRRPIIILLTDGDISVPKSVEADVFWVLCQGDREVPYGTKILLEA